MLRYEPGGLVIYNKRLDHRRMHLVERMQEGDPTVTPFEWRRLIGKHLVKYILTK